MASRKSRSKPESKTAKSATAKPAAKAPTKAAARAAGGDARMAIDLDQLELLMQTLDRHGITELELEKGGERIVLRRGGVPVVAAPQLVHAAPAPAPAAPAPAAAPASKPKDVADANTVFVTSPFVGTFYRAPNPSAPAFVEAGASVKKGQPLCIVEAMKLMNEIEAEVEGTIVEILAENGKPVEYGEKLFKIQKR